MKHFDICIIGGGASGCAAAIEAARNNGELKICVLEKNREILRKVKASGNGRCNISNKACAEYEETASFFESIGVIFAEEEGGRLYPYNRAAASVTEALSLEMRRLGISAFTECSVLEIEEGFIITTSKGKLSAGRVLLASGGKSSPQFGTTGDGYVLARKLGHTVSRLRPSLTALECEGNFRELKGARALAKAALLKDGTEIASEEGEVQFTEDGLSGICIFNLSRFLIVEPGEDFRSSMKHYSIAIDFMPEFTQEQAARMIGRGAFVSILKKQLQKAVPPEEIKNWTVQIKGAKGWKQSQVTAGGVSMDEIDKDTMESSLVKNLYFAGEVTDYDGPCGGFNLNHAWITGLKAGRAMARDVQSKSV